MRKIIVKIVCYLLSILVFLAGLFVFMYPVINRNLINNNAKRNLESFQSTRQVYMREKDKSKNDKDSQSSENSYFESEKLDELYEDMKKYNDRIYEEGQKNLKDAWSYEQSTFDLYSYGIYNGVIGEIKIPAMDCDLPLYMGATMSNMAKGVAQLGETSAPIGGENTNCVIAGHRGASGGKFFLDIQNLKIGDKVYIDNLWESLTYRVTKIEIIKPTDIDRIFIQEGKDMVTLITCHPYPNNYQRYVVYCERGEDKTQNQGTDEEEDIEANEDIVTQIDTDKENESSVTFMKIEEIAYVVIPIILILLFVILTFTGRKKRKKDEE